MAGHVLYASIKFEIRSCVMRYDAFAATTPCTYSVPALTGTSSAPGHLADTSSAPSQGTKPHLSASAHVSAADTLTLLIMASATVTVYRGHRHTLLPARD